MLLYTFLNENAPHKEQHGAAYELLSYGLKKLYGISEYSVETGEHGKPFLAEYPEIHFNLSHCKGLAVCGISGFPVGVDAEYVRGFDKRVLKRFSEAERCFILDSDKCQENFFRIWTLKEAVGKYFGTGVLPVLKEYSFAFDGENILCGKAGDMIFTQKLLHEKWLVSICTHKPENEFVFV